MYVARILFPVKVLGPGNRVGIWFCGCKHGCKGCSNPELWNFDERYSTTLPVIKTLLEKINQQANIDGFTLTGGDPMEQPEALEELLPVLKLYSEDILVYTGYKYEDIKYKYANILKHITVLIDGKYIEEQNHASPLKGSDNQSIIILDPTRNDFYNNYLNSVTNEIQNFTLGDSVISVGIHKPDYVTELDALLERKGLKTNE